MLALYRSGRQAEALKAYLEVRELLVEQIGVEPGPELRRLHEAILRQDDELEPPAAEPKGLPPELDVRTPLAGREADLDWLRSTGRRTAAPEVSCWCRGCAGSARRAWSPSWRASCTQRAREWSTSAGRSPAAI